MSIVSSVRRRLSDIFGEDCEKTVTKADIEEANRLRDIAEKGVDLATPYAKYLAKELGLSGNDIQIGPNKTLPRMFEKAIGKLDGHLEDIGDVGRLRVLIDSPEQVLALRRMFHVPPRGKFEHVHVDNHVAVVGFQDYFWEPSKTGRIAFHIDLEVMVSGGQSVGIEIQCIDRRMLKTENSTHVNYQKACAIERKANSENRELTSDEVTAMNNYRESNRKMYIADSLNYGYYDLRRPDLLREVRSEPALALVG